MSEPTTEAGRSTLHDWREYARVWADNENDPTLLPAILAIEAEARAALRAELIAEVEGLDWMELLHDLDGTQHFVTHGMSYDGDDLEGVECMTGAIGHADDAVDVRAAVLAALRGDKPDEVGR